MKEKPICKNTEKGVYWWCTCGKSKEQPFCDGSHMGSEFLPTEIVVDKEEMICWCTCKKTKNPPYCDGSHMK